MKKIFWIITIILLTVISFKLLSNEDDWICDNGECVKHGYPLASEPDDCCK